MNINLQEMKTAVLARIAEVEKRTGWKLPNIEIRYDLKSRRLAGEAIYNYADRSRLIMRLNPIMWNYNKQQYIYDTVVHEWSHLVDVYFNGKSSHHGSEWQNIMLKAGVTPTRCHKMEIPKEVRAGRSAPTTTCTCEKCLTTFEMGPRQIAIMRQGRTYSHHKCGGKLVIGDLTAPTPVVAPTVAPVVAPVVTAPVVQQPTIAQPGTGSKVERCKVIFVRMSGASRKDIIEAFMIEVGMTKSGAATYYQNIKGSMGS